ncbi:MAG: site-specific integrase [Hyphomicrobium sp.]|uniref:tyrosine-type recombinase/integrase n=1 Tax=Hyphomicrobium sp. TaxID=82 RepID=UPI0025BCDC45|nr:tyrosine-type recombinase/integrase [Hyphomicrobium sp.]MBX9862369.1 site-specific integrase [Hyphomicrobium sp.]
MKRPHTMLELLKMFGQYLTLNRGCTDATLNTYESGWAQLFRYAKEQRNLRPTQLTVEDLTPEFTNDFLLSLDARGNKVSTRNNRLAAVQAFFQFIAELDPLRYAAQAEYIQTVRLKRGGGPPPIYYLTREEARAVIEAPNVETWAGLRNRALLTLMFQTGIRSSEARALLLEDFYVHPSPGIRIRNGKGRKSRDLPLHANTVAELNAWLRVRGTEDGPLFPTNRITHMKSGALELIVKTSVEKAVKTCSTLSNRNIHPHILRHTAAMFMLDSGVDLAVIALHLGHADVKTTYRYLHHNRRIKEKAMNQTSFPVPKPRAAANDNEDLVEAYGPRKKYLSRS